MINIKKGFTLVELLVVIAIISILVLMVIIAIDPIRIIEETRDARNRSEMNQLKTALQLFFNDQNRYPATGSLTDLEPNYTRVLPSVTTATGFAYAANAGETNYDAIVEINHPTGDDTASVTRCITDGDETSASGADDFMICPD